MSLEDVVASQQAVSELLHDYITAERVSQSPPWETSAGTHLIADFECREGSAYRQRDDEYAAAYPREGAAALKKKKKSLCNQFANHVSNPAEVVVSL